MGSGGYDSIPFHETQEQVDLRVEQEVMNDLIRDREEGISQMNKIMRDIRDLAKDIQAEIGAQGETVDNLERNV